MDKKGPSDENYRARIEIISCYYYTYALELIISGVVKWLQSNTEAVVLLHGVGFVTAHRHLFSLIA